jgi:hypothetical protein
MLGYERDYGTARAVHSFVEILGWITVAFGAIFALAGMAGGGVIGLFGGDPGVAGRMLAALPGIAIAMGGLIEVALVQTARAGVDTAEMTRELLRLARREATTSVTPASSIDGVVMTADGLDASTGWEVEKYRGVSINASPQGFLVGKRAFSELDEARAFVDRAYERRRQQQE